MRSVSRQREPRHGSAPPTPSSGAASLLVPLSLTRPRVQGGWQGHQAEISASMPSCIYTGWMLWDHSSPDDDRASSSCRSPRLSGDEMLAAKLKETIIAAASSSNSSKLYIGGAKARPGI
uniref:Uncharacterized protein n=1 Tax=Oryza punctata TaxID=4537 RepID=A0A0E0LZK2_ORYPU